MVSSPLRSSRVFPQSDCASNGFLGGLQRVLQGGWIHGHGAISVAILASLSAKRLRSKGFLGAIPRGRHAILKIPNYTPRLVYSSIETPRCPRSASAPKAPKVALRPKVP